AGGPWPHGAWTLSRFSRLLGDHLTANAQFDGSRFQSDVDAPSITSLLLEALRDELQTNAEVPNVAFVGEDETDALYFERAAVVLTEELGLDVVSGCSPRAAGAAREGGASAVVGVLMELRGKQRPAVGLFANDEVGRAAIKSARDF